MAINLKNPQKRQGALDALRAILTSKRRTFQIDPEDVDKKNEKKNDLEQPKDQQGASQSAQDSNQQNKQGGQDGSKHDRLRVNGLVMPKNTEVKKQDEDKDKPKETAEEKRQRIQKINDPKEIEQDLTDIRSDKIERDRQAEKARKDAAKEVAKQAHGGLLDFDDFKVDLFMAIKSQIGVSRHPEDTYNRPNPSYAGTDFLMPGTDYVEKKNIPSLAVYFDQSNSWGAADIDKGKEAINVLNGFVAKKKIKKIDLYFFANNLHTTPKGQGWSEISTHGFDQVLKSIADHNYTNVIIMSDKDLDSQTYWSKAPMVKVRGCVWWIWRKSTSSEVLKYLKGERGNYQYSLSSYKDFI